MRVLMTGAGGQLGQALLALPPRADTEWLLFTRAQLDITDRQTVQRLVAKYRPDVIINTAAYTGVDKAETDSEQAFTVNAKGPEILAQVCTEHQVALVQLSTDFVFSGTATQPYTEVDTTDPQSVYGRSKLAGEQAVLTSPGVQALVLRTSWLCSRYGDNFVKTLLAKMQQGQHLQVVNDQIGSFTLADDLAGWIVELLPLLRQGKLPPLLHAANSGQCSWYDLAVAIQKTAVEQGVLQQPVAITPVSTAAYSAGKTLAPRPAYSALDNHLLSHYLPQPPQSWQQALARCVAGLHTSSDKHS
ncbi:dTDP-4-dehydrorhamnose reductase [Venatoribacter cucullus]|uniref:dTDP-4-dehydrorhamnose reductase n=1 Tax=Venatoribacter cucullus TaxID=2661630 RepID=A0A9X7UX59_9GAMM|nr:dTDP-4-dehydrorhamnose reductase [Venatoribacter cucullus]QQD23676.1 dTDP-4-dehydrorhamnose reductase [Venatoribacter cucullus]